ncbi:MAG: hypothetical protein HYT99_05195, partial [Candidatus Tectomicrobia bacterium]|nr:hypothetical protein [Candidatus Tectomicrobia bacterium]
MRQLKDILTDSTLGSFVGKIYEIQLMAGECYGPFYRVSEENLGRDDNVAERYKKSAKHSRTGLIKQWKGKSINPTKLDAFLKKNFETIEMDPKFSLLGEVKKFFSKSVHCSIENDYRKLSQGRWCGLAKPKNFQGAIELYRVGHLGTASR